MALLCYVVVLCCLQTWGDQAENVARPYERYVVVVVVAVVVCVDLESLCFF